MAMKKLRVDELKAGMVFDKAVYIDMNNILVAPMVPLREEDIQRLIKWGIEEIETAGDVIKQASPEQKLSIKEEVTKLTKLAESGEGIKEGEKSISDVFDGMLPLTEDIFDKVRNAAGYEKEKILDAVSEAIEHVKKDKNSTLGELTREHEGRYIHTLGVSVAMLSAVVGIDIGYGKHRLITLCTGALLHDIGMVRVPSYITEKKGKLTPDEYNRIKTHPIYGYRIVTKELELGEETAAIVLQHHEAYDGSGYPRKLKGDSISVFAKIVSICDAFVAMTRKRSYRDEHLSYQAMKIILSGASRKFDPEIVKVFLSNLAIYPVGSIIQLSNNAVGRVVSANPDLPLRPKIAIIVDEFGDKVEKEKTLDLQQTDSLYIKKPLSKFILKQILNE
jgi:HD-GYP domain-containing protein (c-di-GMP phosphodiesterase class II)